jgi:hypothetical protein
MSNFNHSIFLSDWELADDHANIAEYRHKNKVLVVSLCWINTYKAWVEFDTKHSPGLHFCHNGKVDSDKWACANGLQHVWLGTTRSRNLNRLW